MKLDWGSIRIKILISKTNFHIKIPQPKPFWSLFKLYRLILKIIRFSRDQLSKDFLWEMIEWLSGNSQVFKRRLFRLHRDINVNITALSKIYMLLMFLSCKKLTKIFKLQNLDRKNEWWLSSLEFNKNLSSHTKKFRFLIILFLWLA